MNGYGWVLITVMMLATIVALQGCTQFDKQDRSAKSWQVDVRAVPGECAVSIDVYNEDSFDDNTIDVQRPGGKG